MPAITLQLKFVDGYFLDEAGNGISDAIVAADLSDRVVRKADRAITEIDGHVEATTNADGYWVMGLHPTNDTADSPTNTTWTITEPGGHTETIQIDKDDAHGDSEADPIAYTDLIDLPIDNQPPVDWQAQLTSLSTTVTGLSNVIDLMLTMDSASLAALTPARATDLIDAAAAASVEATTSVHGLLSAADKLKLDGLDGSTYAKLNAAKTAILLPTPNPDPTTSGAEAWLFQSSTDLTAQIMRGVNKVQLAPAFDAPALQLSADVNITTGSYTTSPQTLSTVTVVANALYFFFGSVLTVAQGNYNIGVRFSSIPSGATLRWGGAGLAELPNNPAGGGGIGSIDANLNTGSGELLIPGQGSTTNITTFVYGTLRTGASAGTLNFQSRQVVVTAGGTITPKVLAGTALSFTRVL